MHDFVECISMKNVATSAVEDTFWREKLKHETNSSKKTMCDVMIAMVAEMEETVSMEMIEAGRVSIIYDGWSKFGEHYFGLWIVCYLHHYAPEDK